MTTYTIKPLKWDNFGGGAWRAVTVVGDYIVNQFDGRLAYWRGPQLRGVKGGRKPTVEEAKLACERSYQAVLRRALQRVT